MSERKRIRCYLVQDKSSHKGSGGGFTVVKFYHLSVENRTPISLRSVTVSYRLMKGKEPVQEGTLRAEQVEPGKIVRSQSFIRESLVFDRVEWVSDPVVEADQDISADWITFNKKLPRSSRTGCFIGMLLAVSVAIMLYLLVIRN